MQRSHIITGLVLVVLVVSLASLARWITAPPAPEPSVFPDQLQVRVLLPNESSGEVRRVAYYGQDNITPLRVEVEYKDGFTGLATYGAYGNLSTFTKYFPQADGESLQPELKLVYADDGVHIQSEEQFFANGNLKRTGIRVAHQNYLVNDFDQNNPGQSVVSVFNPDGIKYSSFEFHGNGSLAQLVMETDDKGVETTDFNEDGVRTHYASVKWDTLKVWETYQADGETLLHRFEQKSEGNQFATIYSIFATYHGPDGTVLERRRFNRTVMEVNVLDVDGNVLFVQTWYNKEKTDAKVESFGPDAWYLHMVNMGSDYAESIWFDETSGYVNRHNRDIKLNNGDEKMEYRWFYPDGSLKSKNTPNLETGEYEKTEYEPGESTERFDQSRLQYAIDARPYVVPPELPPKNETMTHGGP